MNIDATFWVTIAFFIFFGGLIYLKVPQKVNVTLSKYIDEIKKELEEAEKLKKEAKNLLSNYENKIDKAKKESKEIIYTARNESEKTVLENIIKVFIIFSNFILSKISKKKEINNGAKR